VLGSSSRHDEPQPPHKTQRLNKSLKTTTQQSKQTQKHKKQSKQTQKQKKQSSTLRDAGRKR
jgi:hypothetical protein